MADTVVGLAVETLTNLIIREADLLIGVKEKVEWIETEFKLMESHLQSIDALHQIPSNAYGSMEETRSIIRITENVIETYTKRTDQSKTASLRKKLFSWYEQRNLALDLEKIKDKIIRVRQRWKSVDFQNQDLSASSYHRDSSKSVENQDLAASSSHHVPSGTAAIRKLDSALQSKDVNGELLMRIRLVRDEVVRLHKFSLEIDAVISLELLSERQKVWIQELRHIFQFVDESFASLESSSLLLLCTGQTSEKYGETISKIQSKIFQLYRRYHVYGVGEIQVNSDGTSRSIFPSIRMDSALISSVTEKRVTAFMPHIFFNSLISSIIVHIFVSLAEARKIQSLEVEMKLMKALLEDARSMRCLDKRVNVWLDQIRKISNDLENLIINSTDNSQGKNGWSGHIFCPSKIANKLRLIRHEMGDITARKRRYGIDIAMGEAGKSHNFTAAEDSSKYSSLKSFIFKDDFTRQIQSVESELHLMQAFLEDVKTMENIDARLKFWVEELRGVEREAMAILEHQSAKSPYGKRFGRIGVARRIYRFNNRISVMSKWKQTYDIGDVRSRKISNFVNHELREIEQHPSTDELREIEQQQSTAENQECELIRRELKLMEAFDRDIIDVEGLDGTAKVWVETMHNIAEDAKKLIFNYDLSRKFKFAIAKPFINILFPQFTWRGTDVARINDRIARLSETRMEYGIEHRKKLPPYIVSELKAKLLEHHEYPCVIPVIGMSDTHKEALKELLHNEKAITGHFDCWAWVCVSRELSGMPILRDMLKQIIDQQTTGYLQEETMQMLAKLPSDKRFLVVLDEVQSVEIWHFLEPAFRQTSTGSRIILVTHEHTNSLLNSNSDGLSDNTGLRRQMEDIEEVFEKLSLLEPVKLTKIQSETGDENTVPSYLKQCLYYFLLFPANVEVQVRRLIVLWVAEGLVRPNRDVNEPVERTAESYLKKLIDLKLVRVTKKKLNGKVKACQLYDGKRDMWLKEAKMARFLPDATTAKITRLVDYHGGNESCFIKIHGNSNSSTSLGKYKDVHSFLSFDSREGGKPGEDIGNFLRKCIAARCFQGLRVLDLERVFRPKLPEKIALLTGLRYLGLRWTYLENLPTCIIKLLNLQVLDVKHTYISILPRTIWSMRYLRHLYLSETFRTRFVGRPSEVSLTELQTLWGAFVDEDTAVKQGLDTLTKIRKLGLTCRSRLSQIEEQLRAVDKWISNLKSLESLRLKSRDESGNPSDLLLNPMKNHQNLSTVYLLGKLQPNVVSDFPNNLADITLSGSELREDPMNSLGKLQNLLILRLLAKSVVCVAMHCSSESFPRLKLLSLWKLEMLEQWEVEEGGLPSLEDLEIRSCINLKMLPEVLKSAVTLKSFKLTNMPEKFTDEMKVKQTDFWHRMEPVLEVRNFT